MGTASDWSTAQTKASDWSIDALTLRTHNLDLGDYHKNYHKAFASVRTKRTFLSLPALFPHECHLNLHCEQHESENLLVASGSRVPRRKFPTLAPVSQSRAILLRPGPVSHGQRLVGAGGQYILTDYSKTLSFFIK